MTAFHPPPPNEHYQKHLTHMMWFVWNELLDVAHSEIFTVVNFFYDSLVPSSNSQPPSVRCFLLAKRLNQTSGSEIRLLNSCAILIPLPVATWLPY